MINTINILSGLGNENRLRLFLILLKRDLCVCQLQEILEMEQSRISHQLRILKFYGLVEARQYGRWVVYTVPEEVRKNPVILAIKQSPELAAFMKEKIPRVRVLEIKRDKMAASSREKQK